MGDITSARPSIDVAAMTEVIRCPTIEAMKALSLAHRER
jgi:hypothetical protein